MNIRKNYTDVYYFLEELYKKDEIRINLSNFSFLLGSVWIFFLASSLFIASIGFVFNIKISVFYLFFLAFFTIIYLFYATKYYFKENNIKFFIILLSVNLIIFILLLYISGVFYDLSVDGQFYHQEAILQLAYGWNPYYGDIKDDGFANAHGFNYINHYAKGPWIYSSIIFKVTNNIENGKVFNSLLVFSVLLLTFSALLTLKYLSILNSFFISFLLVFNPVVITKIISYYLDGQLYLLLLLFFIFCILLIKKIDPIILLIYSMDIIIFVNTKFTSVVYASIFIMAFLCFLFITGNKKNFFIIIKISFLSLLFGICFVGFNPYMTNTINHGHPFYPLFGNSSSFPQYDGPRNFSKLNNFEDLVYSIFATSEHTWEETGNIKFKIPFTVNKNELNNFIIPDTSIGGLGPLFGGIIILSILILIFCFILDFKSSFFVIVITCVIIFSIVIKQHAWYARYNPQLWIIPFLYIILSFYIKKPLSGLVRILSCIAIVAIFVNIFLVSMYYFDFQIKATTSMKHDLLQLKEMASRKKILVYFGPLRAHRLRFQKFGIPYKEVKTLEDLPTNNRIHMGCTETYYCIIDNNLNYKK